MAGCIAVARVVCAGIDVIALRITCSRIIASFVGEPISASRAHIVCDVLVYSTVCDVAGRGGAIGWITRVVGCSRSAWFAVVSFDVLVCSTTRYFAVAEIKRIRVLRSSSGFAGSGVKLKEFGTGRIAGYRCSCELDGARDRQ